MQQVLARLEMHVHVVETFLGMGLMENCMYTLHRVTMPKLADFKPVHLANTILALKKLNCKVGVSSP